MADMAMVRRYAYGSFNHLKSCALMRDSMFDALRGQGQQNEQPKVCTCGCSEFEVWLREQGL